MKPPIEYYKSITIDQKTISLEPNSVIVFVGPNNVGKTTAVKELQNNVTSGNLIHNNKTNTVVKAAELERPADVNDPALNEWLQNFIDPVKPNPQGDPELVAFRNWGTGVNTRVNQMAESIVYRHNSWNDAAFLISTGEGVALDGGTPDYYNYSPGNGGNLQYEQLFNDEMKEKALSGLSLKVFSTPISVSRVGRQSHMHYGNLPAAIKTPPSEHDQKLLRETPRVSDQGMGVVNLIKLGVAMTTGHEPLVFLDEPEAHLHPPQARKAGEFVADRSDRSQIFITTHSVDFLLGLLDSGKQVVIIRLDRKGGATGASELGGATLVDAWKDPVIRYSNALRGLMHKGVVVCEGEADCMFFQATLDYETQQMAKGSHDLLFIPSGGKAGIKRIVPALKKLSVPVAVVTDFDFLRNWDDIKALVKTLGHDPTHLQKDWKVLHEHLLSINDKRNIDAVTQEIDKYLSSFDRAEPYSRDHMEKLRVLSKTNDGWAHAKNSGISSLSGGPNLAGLRLLEALKEIGILVIPFGELESFDRASSAHGTEWLSHVIQTSSYKKLTEQEKRFVTDIPVVVANQQF